MAGVEAAAKRELKKVLKEFYRPSAKEPVLVDVPTLDYLMEPAVAQPMVTVDGGGLLCEARAHAERAAYPIVLKRFLAPSDSRLRRILALLRRAIENVLRNAVQHTPEGTHIRLSGSGDEGSATIAVRDWGPGVPDTALAEIFGPFYRADASRDRSTGGVGLGLAIAQRAIALHGGTIRAENCQPGLRITMRLPRK